ncbi:MAG: hypothetical protein K8T91_28450, partial [Planctomycetes bacterium]|nr:hypothetical protein [Planctomycetota bacterium]
MNSRQESRILTTNQLIVMAAVLSHRSHTLYVRLLFRAVLWVGLSAKAMSGIAWDSEFQSEPASASNKQFMISHWSFPKDEPRLKRFAEAGFNTVIATPEELPACRRHGWQALLAVPSDKAAEFVADPIVWGYFLFDEPAQKKVGYETLVDRMKAFHQLDSKRPAYINLNEKDDPEAFVKILKPRVLSYDYYQWWATQEPFFPLLEKFRRAALGANIPLICWVEAVATPNGPVPA